MTVQETTHRGAVAGYKKIKELRTLIRSTLGISAQGVTVRYVLVKPLDGSAGKWTFPVGFKQLEGPVYCSFVDILAASSSTPA